uniref:Uncharacterized protein n=1 Tax=Panagrolaimus davidi TaxID=227884 RepID=A0A914PT62_9BILA
MSVADRLREKSGIGSDFVSADASQYNNLNLNHNKICDDSIVNKKLSSTYGSQCVSNSDINGEPNHIGGWNNRRSSNTWKKSNVGQLNSLLSINDGHEDKRNKNLLPNSGSSRYISTLTLHIAAYEKLPESGNANFGSNISGKASSHSPFQGHVFEIPRQQEEKATKPEIMNFKASQKLLNPNETKERKRPFQSTEEDRNRQESSNVACAMGESSDEESLKRSKIVHVYFFATSRKSDLETKPRSEFSSVSTDCSGSLISFGELINNHESDDALFNAPNEAALVLARGAGEFSVDWDNEMQKKEKLWICEEHRHILGTEWNKKIHNKLHDKKLACSISIPPIHGKLVDGVSFLSYAQAQEVLKEYGILEHVGTSLCKKHRSEINDLMEKKNLANEIVNSTSSNETPMEIDDNALLPRKAKMNAVGSYREWSPSDCLEPHRSPVKPWYDKDTGRLPFGVSSSAKTAFKNFTKLANINITTTTRPWEELDVRSRNMYIAGYKKICGTTAAILVGDENKEKLQEAAIKKSAISKQQTLLNESQLQLLYEIKKHYYAAGSNQERRAYLSIAADVLPENIVRSVIPDLSRYEYTEAKKEAKRFKSKEQKKPRAYKEVVPKTAIESFIAFFTSEMITTGIPFGDITTKLPNGNIVQLPSVVREWGAGKIIAMYRSHMKETGEKVEMKESIIECS